jgi:hypothetical protein
VADQVRQQAVDHVSFDGYLRHDAMVLIDTVTGDATWKKCGAAPSERSR